MNAWVDYLKSKSFFSLVGTWSLLSVGLLLILFYGILPLYTRQGKEFPMPDLQGKTWAQAQKLAQKYHFRLVIQDSQYVSGVGGGQVYRQEPSAGVPVKKNRQVYLTMTRFVPPKIAFPQVSDLPYDQARRLLEETYRLRVGKLLYQPGDVPNIVMGALWRNKRLQVGDWVPQDAEIDLIISRGLGQSKVRFIVVEGLPYEEAVSRLQGAGLSIGSVRWGGKDPRYPEGYVYRQYPAKVPRDSVLEGYAVDLFINGAPQKIQDTEDL
ncbi:MAG: PASTA domain-containing protein [Bacteroidia bacterium]